MNWLKNNWFNLLATVLLFVGLSNHPYNFFQLLRWVVCLVAIYNIYLVYKQGKKVWLGIFGITAIIFNPIAPFYFDKSTWHEIDFIGALIFFIALFVIKPAKN